jgi:serine/threonine-protein phosphatase 5
MVTVDDKSAAMALKQQGNKAFAGHDWPRAIDFYTKAIEKYDADPSFWCNRAQAQIKLEAYGYAISDASKALELDKNYIKVGHVCSMLTTSF